MFSRLIRRLPYYPPTEDIFLFLYTKSVSFQGGTHLNYVVDQVIEKLISVIKRKCGKNSVAIKPFQIKNHLWVFVNCLIENPAFDSQTKENMTLRAKAFGSECSLGEKFVKQVRYDGCLKKECDWLEKKGITLMEFVQNLEFFQNYNYINLGHILQ